MTDIAVELENEDIEVPVTFEATGTEISLTYDDDETVIDIDVIG